MIEADHVHCLERHLIRILAGEGVDHPLVRQVVVEERSALLTVEWDEAGKPTRSSAAYWAVQIEDRLAFYGRPLDEFLTVEACQAWGSTCERALARACQRCEV